MSVILSIGTALPPFVVSQEQAAAFALQHFRGRLPKQESLMQVFPNTRIAKRHFVVPLEWFETPEHTWQERNAIYLRSAEALGMRAAQAALTNARLPPAAVDFVAFVSTTGLATPSLDARMIETLGMRPNTRRLPIWGLGCAGGVAGLAHVAEFTRAEPDAIGLLIAVETCSITFQFHDFSKKNLVAASLFADGAAAAVIAGDRAARGGLRVVGSYSHLFPNSAHVMGWEVLDSGLSVIFAPEIPARIARDLPPVVDAMMRALERPAHSIRHYALHPGGARVLDAYAAAFSLSADDLDCSAQVLRDCGNMSSPTVLFVLDRLMRQRRIRTGECVLLGALGPGFSAELALLEGG
ncbi:MAG: type III polyketide synthase [Thermoflexales bacterium]